MERIKRYLRSAAGYQAVCAKWLVLAALVGCVVGPLGGAFGLALNWANATRGAHPWLLYLLPVAGLVIVFLYHRFDPDGGGSTNQIFVSVREHKPLTLRTAPLIFVSPSMKISIPGLSSFFFILICSLSPWQRAIPLCLKLNAPDCLNPLASICSSTFFVISSNVIILLSSLLICMSDSYKNLLYFLIVVEGSRQLLQWTRSYRLR